MKSPINTLVPTIGLEIHAELATHSKMFCSCANDSDEKRPNSNICPICLGHPGTLPVLNRQAIRHVLAVGHALGGTIADYTEWDRKNYFYPDIPKGYQISQYKYPLVTGGAVPVSVAAGQAGIAITRIHLEEDTAKSTHDTGDLSLVDFNRSGLPLMELVTEPVIHDAETAGAFARELRLLLRTLGVAEANMEKGELRVEANVSVASPEDTAAGKFGTKTEVKNLNSFRSVERAIAYEIKRQTELLSKGEAIVQETRGWDENGQKTFSQRAKESSHDYRYFPEPDLPKLIISEIPEFSPAAIKKGMPELPWEKRGRYQDTYGMTAKEAELFVESLALTAYFESIIAGFAGDKKKVKLAINYLLTDYLGLLKKAGSVDFKSSELETVSAGSFAELIDMTAKGEVSSRGAKDLLEVLLNEKTAFQDKAGSVRDLAEKRSLLQKSDAGDIERIVADAIAKNPAVVADYKSGKAAALQFLIGQGMRLSKGSANPEILKKTFMAQLG
jgi:aspartyl-tRNA(Asn)/glutamyl-tRNA(Gln) amidotransferase subunit B